MLSRPPLLLKIEEAVILAAAIILYSHFHLSWILFAIIFLAPDLFMVGYLANPRVGSALYNLVHTLTLPLILAAYSWEQNRSVPLAIALIWIAHIAIDRLLGYGLKYPSAFKDTHLQRI